MAKNIDPSRMGKKGGKARAEALTPEQRSDIARKAAATRWRTGDEATMPKAICGGEQPLRIGKAEIPCYVLDDERRVITISGLFTALGMQIGGGLTRLASFAEQIASNPAGAKDLSSRLESPIEFVLPKGGTAKGYEAQLLVNLCEAILDARRAKRLTPRYEAFANAAETVLAAFAVVGIIALVDEATGYQAVRKRMALAEILDKYLDDKLNVWTKTFPDEFYEQYFKLKGWDYSRLQAGDVKPVEVAEFTRDEVYRRLHPGIVDELERSNPFVVPGRRLWKHHQWLTREVGHPTLKTHVAVIIALMKTSKSWPQFMANLQEALPRLDDTGYFDFIKDEDAPRLPPPRTPPGEASGPARPRP